jgi:hypothetical protein
VGQAARRTRVRITCTPACCSPLEGVTMGAVAPGTHWKLSGVSILLVPYLQHGREIRVAADLRRDTCGITARRIPC